MTSVQYTLPLLDNIDSCPAMTSVQYTLPSRLSKPTPITWGSPLATEKYFWLVRFTPRTSVLVAKYIRVSGELARQVETTLLSDSPIILLFVEVAVALLVLEWSGI